MIRSVKSQLILFLTVLAIFLAVREKDFAFLGVLLTTMAVSVIAESLILYLKTGSFQITESSAITGLITGYVLSSDEALWKLSLAAVLAILSKHLIAFKKRHIFNPAAFGIFLGAILLGISTQWKGTYLWYIMIPFGAYFSYRMRKIEVIVGYAIISLIVFGGQAIAQRAPLVTIFGYFSYFYIFVMVIEPKTSPIRPISKYIFGAGTAVLVFILTEAGVRFDAELLSLLVMNATVPLLNKISFKGGPS